VLLQVLLRRERLVVVRRRRHVFRSWRVEA
jgi:hypothetical protein